MLKDYNHLPGFLLRWTVVKIGKLHVRVHHIIASDGTSFLHTHPFSYVSIILKGGYTEEVLKKDTLHLVKNKVGSIIIRTATTPHRILSLRGETCKTFFITWAHPTWRLVKHRDVKDFIVNKVPSSAGVYKRVIKGKEQYAKFDEFWYVSRQTQEEAEKATTPSIYQCGDWEVC